MAAEGAAGVAAGLFDLPDVGTEVGELDGAEGALLEAGEVEDADAVEGSGHSPPFQGLVDASRLLEWLETIRLARGCLREGGREEGLHIGV